MTALFALVVTLPLAQTTAEVDYSALVARPPPVKMALARTGLFGWGLGLELPVAGVVTGVGSEARPGVGAAWGGAISWEALPEALVRLGVLYRETYTGRGTVTFIDAAQRTEARQDADWIGLELSLGGAYLARDLSRAWTPFVGGELGLAFQGLVYDFDADHQQLRAEDLGSATEQCTDAECKSTIHDALAIAPTFTARGGVRWETLTWLAMQAELGLTYARQADVRVSNTVRALDVRPPSQGVWLVQALVGARFGL